MLLDGNVDEINIKNRIAQINGEKSDKIRITGDLIVTNLNSVLQRFIKRRIEI